MNALHALARTLAFLSRTPVWPAAHARPARLGDDAAAFPFAGIAIAAPAALILLGFDALGLSPILGALAATAFLVWWTVALHEDGLADTADALFGHHPRDRTLAIMHDSRIGTYGAATLILALGARVVLLAEIAEAGAGAAALALLGVAAGSRGAMAHLWSSLPPADADGLAVRVGQPAPRTGRLAIGLGSAVAFALGLVFAGPAALVAIVLALGVHLVFRRSLRRRLGGQTGDTIGCDQQLTEIALLLGFAIAV